MKKVFAVLLSLIAVFCCIGLFACNGQSGKDGKSAYEIWLDNGYEGTESDFLSWLRGNEYKDGLEFFLLDDDTYGVGGGTMQKYEKITIPPTHNSKPVTRICSASESEYTPGFEDFTFLKAIVIPNSITKISTGAFKGCTSLTNIYYSGSIDEWVSMDGVGNLMWYGASNKTLYINNVPLSNGTISNGITEIEPYAFYGCGGLTEITIPDSVTSIGDYAFYNCSSLESATIGNGVTSIGQSAFSSCSKLKEITIPDSVTSIGSSAFAYCSGLTEITIPDNVTSIGSGAFSNCTSLESVTIGNGVTSIGGSAFQGCSKLTEITIPDSVTSIESSAFYNCSSLESVTIGNGVTSIGGSAFKSCSSLKSVTIGNSVTIIGYSAFSGCSSLTEITIPDSVTSIGEYAFSDCRGLTTVFYNGTAEEWRQIRINSSFDSYLTNATRYYYSETEPTGEGNYWHYVDGVPTKW